VRAKRSSSIERRGRQPNGRDSAVASEAISELARGSAWGVGPRVISATFSRSCFGEAVSPQRM
jgi:hypothetical protein